MTSVQAASRRPGTRIRRKQPSEEAMVYIVERVEARTHRHKGDVLVHASGQTFRP